MSKDRLYIFDTTLRDGAQTQGVDFSIDDKEKISEIQKSAEEELGNPEINDQEKYLLDQKIEVLKSIN